MFDGLYIASLSSYNVHMYCTSKQIDVFVMPYVDWLNINIIYPSTIYVDKGRLPKRGKYGKISGWEQVHKNSCLWNRNTNWFKRILWEFQLGKGKTLGLIRETYSRLERVWWVTSRLGEGKQWNLFLRCGTI